MPKATFTDEEFIVAVKNSKSISEVLRKLSLGLFGGNYKTFKRTVERLKLDINHFTGKGHLKGKNHNWNKKYLTADLLVENNFYCSYNLKKRLICEGYLQNVCAVCNIFTWQGKILSLHLDHINGINTDNRLSNLRLLCPNCHSLTETYAGKNKKRKPKKLPHARSIYLCIDCKQIISRKKTLRCIKCANMHKSHSKIQWPTTKDLILMVEETSYVSVAKKLGVSDNAVRKRIKTHPI
jgi:hypothetical protein